MPAEEADGGVRESVPPFRRSAVRRSRPAPKARKKAKKPGAAVAAANEESDTPPIELLTAAGDEDIDAGEAQLDRLGQSLLETLAHVQGRGHDRRADDRAGGDPVRGRCRRQA